MRSLPRSLPGSIAPTVPAPPDRSTALCSLAIAARFSFRRKRLERAGEGPHRSRPLGAACAGLVLVIALAGLASGTAATALRVASCSAIQNPSGNLLITSDLPLHGAQRAQALQMSRAIAFELARGGWQAGAFSVAYQSCDDSTAARGQWDPGTCQANASSYAADRRVVGVIGPLNSGCAELELPVVNRASEGPLAMVSPATTYVGLTHEGAGIAPGEPAQYYPSGRRSFARVVAANDVQGAADAVLASRLHVTKLFVLNDREAYGEGISAAAAHAAKKLGIAVVRVTSWDPNAASYSGVALQVRASGAQAVFLGGLVGKNGGKLIAAIRAGAPGAIIIAPDGFTPVSAAVQQSGGAADGMYVSIAGLPVERLPRAGQTFVKAFAASLGGATVDPYSTYAAQATDVLVQAIASSNGTRAGVSAQLFGVDIPHGILGPISFDADGDVSAGPVTIYVVKGGKSTVSQVIEPKSSLVATS